MVIPVPLGPVLVHVRVQPEAKIIDHESLKNFLQQSGLMELLDSKSVYRFPRAALAKMLGVKPRVLNYLFEGAKPPGDEGHRRVQNSLAR